MVQHEHPYSARVPTGSPVRTCIGCRERALAVDLLRVVVSESGPQGHVLAPDPRRRLPGRGAWLHPVEVCLSLAERRRAFGRALRVSGSVDTSEVDHWVRAGHPPRAVPLEQNRHKHS
ncbi:DNA-binding protein [Rhodococcus sp. ACS1]|uniref:YlxR family protein n=1 Tax=Rhodococcus sp. ACS1 TaxID=2028570 RepID=UPI000BB0FE79|nr:YlxR family protein [Rhodococcus sp. ACS1]PBC52520.1 DNA-binding protein [Rhodococcus sp. ACS1]